MSPIPFIIIGCQRSGTNLVHRYIEQHPQVSMFPEEVRSSLVTHGISGFISASKRRIGEVRDAIDRRGLLHLASLNHCREEPEPLASGFKFAFSHYGPLEGLFQRLGELFGENLRVVHVVREDLLAKAASRARSEATGVWVMQNGQPGGEREPESRLRIPEREFAQFARTHRLIDSDIEERSRGFPYFRIHYERDILPNEPARIAPLLEFLGVGPRELGFPLKKVAPAEVESFVADTERLRAIEQEVNQMSPEALNAASGRFAPRRRNPLNRVVRAVRVLVFGRE